MGWASGIAERRSSLEVQLLDARGAADAQLAEVVKALETIRLALLRMHAGDRDVERVTSDLTVARQLSTDIERRLEARGAVDEVLGDGS